MKNTYCPEICIRELRKRRMDEFKKRAKPLEDNVGAGLKPMLASIIKGGPDSGEIAKKLMESLERQKKEYAERRRALIRDLVAEFAPEIQAHMEAKTEREDVGGLRKAEIIFSERELYSEGGVEAAKGILLEGLSGISEEDTPVPQNTLIQLWMAHGERLPAKESAAASIKEFIANELRGLGVPVSDGLVEGLEAALEVQGMDLNANPMDARMAILEALVKTKTSEDTADDGVPGESAELVDAAPAPVVRAAPARVSAYKEKGFQINASHVRAIMASEGIPEKEARAYIGAIVYGYKLGSSKPAIGNVYFNTNAIQKNLRGVAEIKQLGMRPINVIKFLERKGVVSIMKSGDTGSLNLRTTDLEEPWKSLMVEIFRQHQGITGNAR